MKDEDFVSYVKAESELTTEEKLQAKQRENYLKIHINRNHRYEKRKKLKLAVANFCNKLQTSRGTQVDNSTMIHINIYVRKLLKLPYRWTDKDLRQAYESLDRLERKYLHAPYSKVPKDEGALEETVAKFFDKSNVSDEAKFRIALHILQDQIKGCSSAPDWMKKELIAMIDNQFPHDIHFRDSLVKALRASGNRIHTDNAARIRAEVEAEE